MRRVSFLIGPTPVEPAPRLASALGLDGEDLVIKRDDLTGLGGGGNKVRKLEVTCAEALAAGADVLVTTGAQQSNHARLTAAAGARLGLAVVLVLGGTDPGSAHGNLVLDRLFGAEIVWAGDRPLAAVSAETVARLADAGRRPYEIPYGGSTPASAAAYGDAAQELLVQVPDVAHVVVAVGSGGTMAGLASVLGPERMLGVDTGAVEDPRGAVHALLAGMPGVSVDAADLRIDRDQVGAGYDRLAPSTLAAMELAARTEGLALDATYVGRAMAGLVAATSAGAIRRGERVVLMHTGGLPGLFGHRDIG